MSAPCLLQFVLWMKWPVVTILIVYDLGDGSCFLVIVLVIVTQIYSDGYNLSKVQVEYFQAFR